eukprot:1159742-Pelagomonas_calceolata.AAC.2
MFEGNCPVCVWWEGAPSDGWKKALGALSHTKMGSQILPHHDISQPVNLIYLMTLVKERGQLEVELQWDVP